MVQHLSRHPVSRRALAGRFVLGAALAVALGLGAAQAAPMTFDVPLSGAEQVPPVNTPGSGTAHLTYDPDTHVLKWQITYQNLSGPVTMGHIHGPAPKGKNAGVKIWLTEKGKEASSPITGEAKLSAADEKEMMAGEWYINLHTKAHPGGEVRGQIVPQNPM